MSKHWIPEIMYEGELDDSLTTSIPFIPVPPEEEMPKVIFIFESRETGEIEPGPEGEDLPVSVLDLHQYADMLVLKENLDSETYDKARAALDLEPLGVAFKKGLDINYRIKDNLVGQPHAGEVQ